jgi:hypothetical protein
VADDPRSRIWTPGGEATSAQPPEPEAASVELTPEQLAEAVRRLKVSDVLLSTLSTLAQLGFAKLDRESRDFEQAQLAIESLRALLPVLEAVVPADTLRDFKQAVASLQLAYSSAVEEARSGSQ